MCTNISEDPAASVFRVEEFAVILQDRLLRWRWFRIPYNIAATTLELTIEILNSVF
jgi:hypothetical protein